MRGKRPPFSSAGGLLSLNLRFSPVKEGAALEKRPRPILKWKRYHNVDIKHLDSGTTFFCLFVFLLLLFFFFSMYGCLFFFSL